MGKIVYSLFFGVIFLSAISCASRKSAAQIAEEKRQLIEMIEQRRFQFNADYVIPRGNFRPHSLTSNYGVKVTPDTLTSFLPYFGVAYQAPFHMSGSPLNFESVNFDYTSTDGKKGSTLIKIQIKDRTTPATYIFSIWENANADLTVLDSSRQSIVFRGKIELRRGERN